MVQWSYIKSDPVTGISELKKQWTWLAINIVLHISRGCTHAYLKPSGSERPDVSLWNDGAQTSGEDILCCSLCVCLTFWTNKLWDSPAALSLINIKRCIILTVHYSYMPYIIAI